MILPLLLACTPVDLAPLAVAPAPTDRLFHDVAVYPGFGARLLLHQDVLVRGGRITAVGPTGPAPAGEVVVEGAGRTLLPGLVDAHVHVSAPVSPPWKPALADPERTAAGWLLAGVTTVYDMGGDAASIAAIRASTAVLPRFHAAGTQLTAPEAHPAPAIRSMVPAPLAWFLLRNLETVGTVEEAAPAVARDTGEWVKVIYDALPPTAPHMAPEVLDAIVAATHTSGRKAAVHVGTAQDALDAAHAGADLLAHGVYRGGLSAEQAAALTGLTVIPTLYGFQATRALAAGTWEASALDRRIAPAAVLEATEGPAGAQFVDQAVLGAFAAAIDPDMAVGVRRLYEAGVPLVVGTDAPLPAVVPGAAVHRELAAWVDAGIPAAVALEGATGRAAHLFEADPDFGTVEVGKCADLLLVEGDPLADIRATSRIVLVLREGRAVGADAAALSP